VSICRPHADFREQSWSLKDSEAFGPKPSTSDDLRSRYFGLRCPLRDLTCYQADLRGFPHSIGRIVRSDTIHPSQTFDLLRSHLPMTVWSAPHASPPSSRVSPPPTSHRASTPVTIQTRRLEDRHFGEPLPRDPSRSVLAVFHDLDGLLHTMLAGLLRPATRHGVDCVLTDTLTNDAPPKCGIHWTMMALSSQSHTLRRIPLTQSRTTSPWPYALLPLDCQVSTLSRLVAKLTPCRSPPFLDFRALLPE
jgi:hypothetical protein